jgi:hypothetical protein
MPLVDETGGEMRKRQRKKNGRKFADALLSYYKEYLTMLRLTTRRDAGRQFTNAKYYAMVERLKTEDAEIRRTIDDR